MGFGGWTSIKQLLGYEVTWIDWLIGFFIGLVFVFMLYHLYKFCMKLQNLPKDEPKTNLVGRTATIYVHLGEGAPFGIREHKWSIERSRSCIS